MSSIVFSIINGVNGFTNNAQRCEMSGGTNQETGVIYNTGYTLEFNKGYTISFYYRSSLDCTFESYSQSYYGANYVIVPTNTSNAQLVQSGFTTTSYFSNYLNNNYTNSPILPTYLCFRVYAEFTGIGDYYEIDKINLYKNDDPNYPVCTTNFVENTTTTGITLKGIVDPYGLSTNTYFEYCSGTTTNYTTTTESTGSPYTGTGNQNTTLTIPTTSGGTEYHFRIKATNVSGTTYGRDVKFSSGNVPSISSTSSSNNTLTGITLQSTISTNFLSTTVEFEWGTGTTGSTYDYTVTALQSPVAGFTTVPYTTSSVCSINLTGLTIDRSYHYRVKATNGLGTTYSSNYKWSSYNDSFELGLGTTPPPNWAIETVSGTDPDLPGISFVSSSTTPTVTSAFEGAKYVLFDSYHLSDGSTRLKRTLAFSTSGKTTATVNFAWYEDSGYSSSNDRVEVQWSTNGTSWNTDGSFSRYNATTGWKNKSQALSAGALGQSTLYIGFLFISAYGNNCELDFVTFVTT